jgi:hypothetical protein
MLVPVVPCEPYRLLQGALSLLGLAQSEQHMAQMAPIEDVVGLDGQLSAQKGEVALVLAGLVAGVADVIEGEIAHTDRPPVGGRCLLYGVDDLLVHGVPEADARVVAPQPVVERRREACDLVEVDEERDLLSVVQNGTKLGPRDRP